jgi:hypothetical protein
MIGLVAVGLVTIFIAETANAAYPSRLRRSVEVIIVGESDDAGKTFLTGVFGLPADEAGYCGHVRGEVYCAANGTEEAKLACEIGSGDSAALVVVLDKDALAPGIPPNNFTEYEVNFDIKEFGQREQLREFLARAYSSDSNLFIIDLPVGKNINKAGWHMITDISGWNEGGTISDDAALRKYVGYWDDGLGKFVTADGFGNNGEEELNRDDVVVEPIWGDDFDDIVGKTVCATVHHDEVKGDNLKGNYLGLVAFKLRSISASGKYAEIEILDADNVCGLPLYNNIEETVEVDNPCKMAEGEVFAPGGVDGAIVEGEGTFDVKEGTITCSGDLCTGTAEVKLDSDEGQALCNYLFPGAGTVFYKFVPITRGPADSTYGDYSFTGRIESTDDPTLNDKVICREGGAEGVGFSRYICVPIENVLDPDGNPTTIPECKECVQWEQEDLNPFIP